MSRRLDTAKRVPGNRERAARLLFWLECEGYKVRLEGDFIRVQYRQGGLSDGLRERIRGLKPWLIDILAARGNSRDAG